MDRPYEPDLEKLRRNALRLGVLLLTYAVAGVELWPDATVTLFGIPFRIARADLLPVGLIFACAYAAARFHLYGIMIESSPYRIRRALLNRATALGRRPRYKVPTYVGPSHLTITPWTADLGEIQRLAEDYQRAFPKFAGASLRTTVRQQTSIVPEDNSERVLYGIDVEIPVRCRLAALLHDIEYTSPSWFNIAVLAFLAWRGSL